jgi:hypothetical protein
MIHLCGVPNAIWETSRAKMTDEEALKRAVAVDANMKAVEDTLRALR